MVVESRIASSLVPNNTHIDFKVTYGVFGVKLVDLLKKRQIFQTFPRALLHCENMQYSQQCHVVKGFIFILWWIPTLHPELHRMTGGE